MKRSEIIEMIAHNIYLSEFDFNNGDWYLLESDVKQQYIDTADILLSLLEQAGMEPPKRSRYVEADEYGEGFWLPCNSWEPEDE